jgi:branched-chain amino acid transport system substrate-binding protein
LFAAVLGFTPVRAAESVVVQITVGSTKATINFKDVVLDQPPLIENGRTLVPFRFIGEAIGAQIGWNPTNRTATYVLGAKNIVLTIGSLTATVNGVKTTLDVAPKILSTGRTVVPVRFISESIRAKVDWNSDTKMVTVSVAATLPESAQTIKIGVGVALTGSAALQGTRVQKGAQLAVRDINAAGGINGQMLKLVEMDDQSDPKQAASIASLFVATKDMVACLASYSSSCTLAAAPIYNSGHLVQLNFSVSPAITDAGPYTFRAWNSNTYRTFFSIHVILDAGYTKIGVLYENDDYGRSGLTVVQDEMTKKGLKPLVAEGFLLGGTQDFKTIITKMKSAGCLAVYLVASGSDIAAFATQCAQLGWKPFMCSQGAYDPGVITLGGEAVEGMVGDCFFDPDKMPDKVAAFFKEYNAAFSKAGEETIDIISPCAYDSIRIVAEAMKHGAKTREDIQAYMATLKDFDGIVGTLSFDENGDMVIPLVHVVIKEGKYVLYTGGR